MYELVLASESPRRRELLTDAGFKFQVHPSKISETLEENLTVDEQILDIAVRKAQASVQSLDSHPGSSRLVLAADTMVVLDDKPLGKPADAADALQTLKKLSGRSHWVKTAVCLFDEKTRFADSWIETTEVTFRSLTIAEIEVYVQSGHPLDKAGSYGIQGGGGEFVKSIQGSYTNVVGLPMESVVLRLGQRYGIHPTEDAKPLPNWEQRRHARKVLS